MMGMGAMTRQRGFTLIEAVVVLAAVAAFAAGAAALLSASGSGVETAKAAQHFKAIAAASDAYIRSHRAEIEARTKTGRPAMVSVLDLIAAGNLPAGSSSINSLNQDVCALVFEREAGKFAALVVAQGGTAMPDDALSAMVSQLGITVGGVYQSDQQKIKGPRGAWSLKLADFNNKPNASSSSGHPSRSCGGTQGKTVVLEPGHAVAYFWYGANESAKDGFSPYLYRNAVPGQTQLNQMQTTIEFAVSNVEGQPCTQGQVGRNVEGMLLNCVAYGTQAVWKTVAPTSRCDSGNGYVANIAADGSTTCGTIQASCPAGFVQQITGPNSLTCVDPFANRTTTQCTSQFVVSLDRDGNVTCTDPLAGDVNLTCADGEFIKAIASDGTVSCALSPQGPKGETGFQGSKGLRGPRGIDGQKGDTGLKGLSGLDGTVTTFHIPCDQQTPPACGTGTTAMYAVNAWACVPDHCTLDEYMNGTCCPSGLRAQWYAAGQAWQCVQ